MIPNFLSRFIPRRIQIKDTSPANNINIDTSKDKEIDPTIDFTPKNGYRKPIQPRTMRDIPITGKSKVIMDKPGVNTPGSYYVNVKESFKQWLNLKTF